MCPPSRSIALSLPPSSSLSSSPPPTPTSTALIIVDCQNCSKRIPKRHHPLSQQSSNVDTRLNLSHQSVSQVCVPCPQSVAISTNRLIGCRRCRCCCCCCDYINRINRTDPLTFPFSNLFYPQSYRCFFDFIFNLFQFFSTSTDRGRAHRPLCRRRAWHIATSIICTSRSLSCRAATSRMSNSCPSPRSPTRWPYARPTSIPAAASMPSARIRNHCECLAMRTGSRTTKMTTTMHSMS